MADRYWVGGSGTWDTTSTTNWSTGSGGSSGASAPTSADNVFFDNNSNVGTGSFTVTVSAAVCNNFTASGLDGAMTLALGSSNVSVSGSWSSPGTNFSTTFSNGSIRFVSTSIGNTITTNGGTITGNVSFNGAGGYWTLGSALTMVTTATITLTAGTLDTSVSNYAMTASAISSSNTNVRALKLNGSTVSLSSAAPVDFATQTNATFDFGTSTINLTRASTFTFDGGGLTYWNVSFTSTVAFVKTITSANTFNNLTFATPASAALSSVVLPNNQTINGTLTAVGANGNQRIFIRSDTIGTSRTLTCAAIAAMTDVDFRDITIAGAVGTLSGTRLGNCGGNSGITFDASKTVYWNLAAGGNWSATAWATGSSSGTPAATNFPLAQDTAIIENTGLNTSATITINSSWNISALDTSGRTNAMTLASGTTAPTFYGNFVYGSGVTPTGTGIYTFSNRSTKTLNSGGKTFTQEIIVDAPSGGIQLLTNSLTSNLDFTLTKGTLDLNNLSLTALGFSSSNTNTRTIAFGTGSISCTGVGSSVWNTATSTNLTTTGTQVANLTSSGSAAITVSPGALSEANSISFNFTGGTYALAFLASGGSPSARNVDFTGYAGTWGGPAAGATVYGNLKLSTGMTVGSGNNLNFSATSGIKTITSNGRTMDFPITFNGVGGTWELQDGLTLSVARGSLTLTNGTLNLNGNICNAISFTTAAGTKNLTFNGGTLVCSVASTTSFNNAQPTGFTTTAGTGTGKISMTAATAKTFVGGGSTYNCTLEQAGAGALTITGSNTFTTISNSVQPTTITFTAGTTTTVTNWSVNGTAGNLVTIGSATAAQHTLSKASGIVSSNYLSISYSNAVGGAAWYAGANSTNGGNNTGWVFSSSTAGAGRFLLMFS